MASSEKGGEPTFLRNNIIGLREIVRSGSHRVNNFKACSCWREMGWLISICSWAYSIPVQGPPPNRTLRQLSNHHNNHHHAYFYISHPPMQGSIYMIFDYMDHDMTGLLERSQKDLRGFTPAQVRWKVGFSAPGHLMS